MATDDYFMRLAIDEARKSVPEDGRTHPKVGVVVVKDGKVLTTSHRGERPGDHAEYLALEHKLGGETLVGATVYTTLEPCTTRNHPKVPCAKRLADRKVARVVIGMLDPNPAITGRGLLLLRDANIIIDLFPYERMAEVEELNRDFRRFFAEAQHFHGAFRPVGMRRLSGATRFYKQSAQLVRRWWVTWVGASKPDFVADGLQLVALLGLLWGVVELFGLNLTSQVLGVFGFSAFSVDARPVLLTCLVIIYLRRFFYPFLRRPTEWDVEYRKRKLNLTAALQSATGCVQVELTNARIRNIERNALTAIKSYLEFTVLDRSARNFSVNLLVKHPHMQGNLVCIRRTDPSRGVPTVYDESRMRKVLRTLESGETYYDGDYLRGEKPYRMVWHIPLPSQHFSEGKCVGLVCVDSTKAKHLNLVDERRSLLINLSPYLSLLEFAVAMRFEHRIWDKL